jgi:hypothetical protein
MTLAGPPPGGVSPRPVGFDDGPVYIVVVQLYEVAEPVGGKTPGEIDVSGGSLRVVIPRVVEPDVGRDVDVVLLMVLLLVAVLLVVVFLVVVLLVDPEVVVVIGSNTLQFVVMSPITS